MDHQPPGDTDDSRPHEALEPTSQLLTPARAFARTQLGNHSPDTGTYDRAEQHHVLDDERSDADGL